jgi:hypothetical protein
LSRNKQKWRSLKVAKGGFDAEDAMKMVLAGVALVTLVTPALADYYIIQEPTTKRCRIVEERPAPGVGIVIGEGGFAVRSEAESRMRTVEVCREGTTGGPTIREERRERVVPERVIPER